MADNYSPTVVRTHSDSVLATNKVVRNTYVLLSLTLLFSAITAGIAMVTNAPSMGIATLLVYFGLLFATSALRNSGWGILCVFALTGFMGYTLGPILNMYINAFSNGSQIVMTALGGTGFIFLGLSGYALTTRKDFSYMTGFIAGAGMVLFIGVIASMFIQIPALHLAISCGFMLFSCGIILWETSNIIHGGEKNYIMATISLYVAIYNLFLNLLHILSAFSGRD